jgi:cytidine deaminase
MNKKLTVDYQEFNHFSELDSSEQILVEKAYEICQKAYAPYSKFYVGASLLMKNGEIILGNNQENIAYPSGLCAERVALFYAGANFPNEEIKTICVVAKGDLIDSDACLSPCGSCRQVISETEKRQTIPLKVILVSESGRTFVFNKGTDLLIFPFGLK